MSSQDQRAEANATGKPAAAGPATSNAALAPRYHQMFPVLSAAEIERVRRFGEVRRFVADELLYEAGEAIPGMYVILSGSVSVVPHDVLGKATPIATFAQLIGVTVEEMTKTGPGEVLADIGQLSGRMDLSVIDVRAEGDVEAIFVPPEALRALLVMITDATASCSDDHMHATLDINIPNSASAILIYDQVVESLTDGGQTMNKRTLTLAITAVLLAGLAGTAISAQDKYTVKVPGGLEFSEFRGYEGWQFVSVSEDGGMLAIIVANPAMIDAYKAGIPGNGKPFPDGSKMAKIHYSPKKLETFPAATVPGPQHDVDFMVKDSKRFADSGGWGYAVFDYDAKADTFSPGTLAGNPPQGNDAKCGFQCHTIVKARDYVFTDYGHR